MTKHGGTFKLSGETRDLLRENQEFFEGILGLYDPQDPAKIPLKMSPRDPESRTEAVIQPNGEVEVSFVLAVDDDADPETGRIYLRDSFVFDPSERKLKSYQRSFEYNGKGQGAWQEWLEKYRETVKANPRSIDDPLVTKFAFSAGTTFGRPITDAAGVTLADFKAAFSREHRYLDTTHHLVQKNYPELRFKIRDKLNNYTLVRKDDRLDITFHIAIDADDEPANGRLILSDTFSVDPQTWELKNFSRQWKTTPELADNEEWKAVADSMNQLSANLAEDEKKKFEEEGMAFVRNMAPLLVTGTDLKPEDAWKAALSTPKGQPGAVELSELAKRRLPDPRRGEATAQILETMSVLANESLGLKHDAQSGWWNSKVLRHAPLDLTQAQKSLTSIFSKSLEAAKTKTDATAFEVLKSLTLEGDEANVRDRLLSDRLLVELNSIGSETDAELRAGGLLHFADHQLFRRANMPLSAQALLTTLKALDFVKPKAEEVLATLEGKGSFGNKFEAFLPHFTEQVAHPSSLIAMGGAPFLGVAAEGLGLAGLSRAGMLVGWSGKVGVGGRFIAGAFGLTGEALAFTSLHQLGQSAVHDPSKVTAHFGNEFISGVLLFGAMRAAHAGVNPLTARFLSKKPLDGELLTAPTGRVLLNPRWGAGELTRSGKVLAPILNHGSGIFAMHAANSLSRRFGLMPNDGKDGSSHFLDSALSYGQAVLGFSLANRLTFGRLQGGLAETKLRLESYGQELGQAPVAAKSKLSSRPPSSGLTFRFNKVWVVDARRQKVIWIGSVPGRRKGVEYEDGFARLNVGPEETVSEFHAVLTRDRSDTFWYIGDAGSTYGTYLNGKFLEKGEYVLVKSGALLQLGDSFQLRLEAEGTLIKPDKSIQAKVDLPQSETQKKLGPPTIADTFPFEMLYPGFDVASPQANFEVAQLRPIQAKGEAQKLFSSITVWGKADTAHIFVDKKGRWVLQNLNVDAEIEVHRPAQGEKKENRWMLKRFDKLSSPEEKAAGRHDWVFIESGDRIGLGKQVYEFIAHDQPVEQQANDSGRALSHDPDSIPAPARMPSVPPLTEAEIEQMGDRPTLVNIQPIPAEARRRSQDSEITFAGQPKLTSLERHEGPFPAEYAGQIKPGTPVFELHSGNRVVRGDFQSTSYLIGRNPDAKSQNQTIIVAKGRFIEGAHAEIFLARIPGSKEYQWFLRDNDSEFGTFVGGDQGRKLGSGANREYAALRSDSTFSLGAPVGNSEAVEFSFKLPWASEGHQEAKPASTFPLELIRHFPPEQPPMELVDNFGTLLHTGDRQTTRLIIGSDPESRDTPNSKTLTFKRGGIDEEHCKIFVDSTGQWFLRSLTVEENTYIDGRKVLGGATIAIPPNAEIALGGDAVAGHGMTFILKKGEYLSPERRSSRPPESVDPDAIQLTDLDSEMPTFKPPAGPPPLPSRDRAPTAPVTDLDTPFDPNATQVMRAVTQEDLARRSVEMSEPPLPSAPPTVRRPSGPLHTVARKSTPLPKAPPPAPPVPVKKPEPAPAPVVEPARDESDFGDISAEVIGDGTSFDLGRVVERSASIPPPSSGNDHAPVIPRNSPLPRVEKPANPTLTVVHPALRSKTLFDQIKPWITADKNQLIAHRDEIKAFPRHNFAAENLQGSSELLPLFLGKILKIEESARRANNGQIVHFAEGTKAALKELSDPKKDGNFGQPYRVSFDGTTLLYVSEGFENPNTSLTVHIRPGGEAAMMKGLHERLLALDVPVEFTVPLTAELPNSGYLGILYRAEDAAKVHQAVREFAREYPEILGDKALPFSQALKGWDGNPIPGLGVMEYFIEGNSPTPLDHRFRSAVVRTHTTYVKPSKANGTYSIQQHITQSFQSYLDAGYDLSNAAFRAGSLDASHQGLLPDLYPQE